MDSRPICYKVMCDGRIWAITDNKEFANEVASISNVLDFSITSTSFCEALNIAKLDETIIRRFYSLLD